MKTAETPKTTVVKSKVDKMSFVRSDILLSRYAQLICTGVQSVDMKKWRQY
ncbi:hypothetical protein [Vibrio mytili]|uniref:hypothetical protein n=1 Tax=Vibrio mytili TaxID=50718 RepID=UPI000AC7BBB0|nr:hypothetical protein [Vibrio mytili]